MEKEINIPQREEFKTLIANRSLIYNKISRVYITSKEIEFKINDWQRTKQFHKSMLWFDKKDPLPRILYHESYFSAS